MGSRARWVVVVSSVAALLFGPGAAQQAWFSVKQWRLERRLHALQVRHAQLLAERQQLESDPAYVEGRIRATFKVAKPGEYIVPLEEAKTSPRR
ncbi:MAG: septum formation initiator family protein [Candidatus Omnitrophica bacterium]|nr:septum formation initiator family protein [Candidatus Omnitrophota bacterium]